MKISNSLDLPKLESLEIKSNVGADTLIKVIVNYNTIQYMIL